MVQSIYGKLVQAVAKIAQENQIMLVFDVGSQPNNLVLLWQRARYHEGRGCPVRQNELGRRGHCCGASGVQTRHYSSSLTSACNEPAGTSSGKIAPARRYNPHGRSLSFAHFLWHGKGMLYSQS